MQHKLASKRCTLTHIILLGSIRIRRPGAVEVAFLRSVSVWIV